MTITTLYIQLQISVGILLACSECAVFGVCRGEAPDKQGTGAGCQQEEQLPRL